MYDLIIIGAGLHSLTCLCALLEDEPMPFDLVDSSSGRVRSKLNERTMRRKLLTRLNKKTKEDIWKGRKILVIDKFGKWLQNWKKQFEILGIDSLRSNASLHPDPFDPEMLFEFARMKKISIQDGFSEIIGLKRNKDFVGPFQVPKTFLFNQFCEFLIKSYKLEDVVTRGEVSSIIPTQDNSLLVGLRDGREYQTRRLISAIGHTNIPNYPDWVDTNMLNNQNCVHAWKLVHSEVGYFTNNERIAVVGGGLTSIQLVQLAVDRGCRDVYLIARKRLTVRQFDSDITWSGKLRTEQLRAFWNEERLENRLQMIREARKGGTITVTAMKDLKLLTSDGVCRLLEEVEVWDVHWTGSEFSLELSNGESIEVDKLWLATGSTVDIAKETMFEKVLSEVPVKLCSGYPLLTDDLKLHESLEMFVVGGYASLTLGPDGVNLAGARRAAFRLKRYYSTRPT